MKKEQGKIISFDIEGLSNVWVTHAYNIANDFPVHFHSSYIIGITEQGEREFHYGGQTYFLEQGNIFFIQPFEPHSCNTKGENGHSYKIISFKSEQNFYFPDFTIRNAKLLHLLQKFHILAEYEHSSPKLGEMFNQIVEELKRYSIPNKNNDLGSFLPKIEKAKSFIAKNCLSELTLKTMANVACLSEYHFNRLFHKCFGLSPYAYYLVCKIKKTQKLLIQHDSVIDTTFESGFFDQSHFTRLFKKHVGVTPNKYLNDNKNKQT